VKLVVAPLALAELHDTAAFYTLKANAGLGLAFLAEFERTANFVLANPLLGAVFHGTRRRYILRRFPYSIIYQVAAEEYSSKSSGLKSRLGSCPYTLVA